MTFGWLSWPSSLNMQTRSFLRKIRAAFVAVMEVASDNVHR